MVLNTKHLQMPGILKLLPITVGMQIPLQGNVSAVPLSPPPYLAPLPLEAGAGVPGTAARFAMEHLQRFGPQTALERTGNAGENRIYLAAGMIKKPSTNKGATFLPYLLGRMGCFGFRDRHMHVAAKLERHAC